MPYHIQSHPPTVLFIQFGLNDGNYWETDSGVPRVSPMSFEANLVEIADRALNAGVRSLVINTNHPTTRTDPFPHSPSRSLESSNRAYNELARKVAARFGEEVVLNDVEGAFAASKYDLNVLLHPDGLHLSAEGHAVYFDLCAPVVAQRILDSLEP